MVEIVDFLINIEYIQFLIMMIQGVKNGLIIEKFLSIIILFFFNVWDSTCYFSNFFNYKYNLFYNFEEKNKLYG